MRQCKRICVSPPWQQNILSSTTAATGRQLKQSVNVFHSLMLYRRLPADGWMVGVSPRGPLHHVAINHRCSGQDKTTLSQHCQWDYSTLSTLHGRVELIHRETLLTKLIPSLQLLCLPPHTYATHRLSLLVTQAAAPGLVTTLKSVQTLCENIHKYVRICTEIGDFDRTILAGFCQVAGC